MTLYNKKMSHLKEIDVERTIKALSAASHSPLIEGYDLSGAKGVLVNVTGSPDMTMDEFHEIIDHIHKKVADDALVISGLVVDENIGDSLKVTIVASGLAPAVAAVRNLKIM